MASVTARVATFATTSTRAVVGQKAAKAVSMPMAAPKALKVKLGASAFAGARLQVQQRSVRQVFARAMTTAAFKAAPKGDNTTTDFRIFFESEGKTVSPWHDIPLYNDDGTVNFICEIPKETSAKMEVATDEESTPIKQDIKKGNLRFYPYNINWNYGMLPRTWEDPAVANAECDGVSGDNDPVDVVEIGSATGDMGGVYAVKPVGVYAMIDDGELDWKVIAIRADDPMADKINDVADVEKHMPGELEKVMIWFRDYKMPDGKPANGYGYDSKCLDKKFTMEVIKETAEFYDNLMSGKRENTEGLSLK